VLGFETARVVDAIGGELNGSVCRQQPLLEAFHGFDPEYVANLRPTQVEAIAKNPAVIRNRSKVEATVENANVMLELVAKNGTFHDFLASHPNPEATVQDLKERFHHLGSSSARAFLWRVSEPAPEWRH